MHTHKETNTQKIKKQTHIKTHQPTHTRTTKKDKNVKTTNEK